MQMESLFLLLLFGAAGQSADAVSLVPPADYFQNREIKTDYKSLATLISQQPKSGKEQVGQLMAMRYLGEQAAKWKEDAEYAKMRRTVEDIAAGKTGQDKQGFAKLYAQKLLAQLDGKEPPAPPVSAGKLRDEAFTWFPAAANILAAVDTRLGGAKQSTPLGFDASLLKMIPNEVKSQIYKHLEIVGNVQIDRIAFAYAHGDQRKSEIYLRFSGKANQAWMVDLFKAFGVDMKASRGANGQAIALYDSDRHAPVFAMIGDTEFLVAGYEGSDKNMEVLNKALAIRDNKQANAAKGILKDELKRIPDKACALVVGNFNEEMKRGLGFAFDAAPEALQAHVLRTPNGMDLQLKVDLADAAEGVKFVKKVGSIRDDALAGLKMLPPIPNFPVGQVQNLLQSIQIQPQGAAAEMRVLVPDELFRLLPMATFGFGMARDVPAPPPPVEKK